MICSPIFQCKTNLPTIKTSALQSVAGEVFSKRTPGDAMGFHYTSHVGGGLGDKREHTPVDCVVMEHFSTHIAGHCNQWHKANVTQILS